MLSDRVYKNFLKLNINYNEWLVTTIYYGRQVVDIMQ